VRTIGLLGGMSWESTVTYYTELGRGARARLGGLHSAPGLMISVGFAVVERMQERGAWAEAGQYLAECRNRISIRPGSSATVSRCSFLTRPGARSSTT
jgi:aspartate racemase